MAQKPPKRKQWRIGIRQPDPVKEAAKAEIIAEADRMETIEARQARTLERRQDIMRAVKSGRLDTVSIAGRVLVERGAIRK